MTLRRALAFTLFSALLTVGHGASAQVAPAAYADTMSDQITLTGIRTEDDYALKTNSVIQQVRLYGGGMEYRSRRWYPFEVIASARYLAGQPLDQRFITVAGGIGYVRSIPYHREHFYERISPLCSLQVGATRTSSPDMMYLYQKPVIGFTMLTSAGIDYHSLGHIVVRPFFVENQYLPFGVQGRSSVYWNYGAGIGFSFHNHRNVVSIAY